MNPCDRQGCTQVRQPRVAWVRFPNFGLLQDRVEVDFH
jgi:hypothetical protein